MKVVVVLAVVILVAVRLTLREKGVGSAVVILAAARFILREDLASAVGTIGICLGFLCTGQSSDRLAVGMGLCL